VSSIAERVKLFNSGRVPAYTAIKYQMMADSAFRFLRGTCHLFYEDLQKSIGLPPSPLSWISGDLHLENFGTYKGDNRLVYFDLNDFDEGVLAPANWELARMVTSIFTGFESVGVKKKESGRMAALFLKTYSSTLTRGKARFLETETADGIVKSFMEKVCERRQKDLISQRTVVKNDRLQIKIDHARFFPLEKPLKKELKAHLATRISEYPLFRSRYEILDVAFRIAGTGSLGGQRFVFLLRNMEEKKKHLLIDMKEAEPSSLSPYLPVPQPAWASEAHRVVAIQDRMQNVSPALLGITSFKGVAYIIKEMQPIADKIDFLVIRDRFKDIECVIQDMALLTASAQLRSAGRQGSALPDELIAHGQEEDWQAGLITYAENYSAQVQKDYQEYFAAFKSGFFNQ
jgi:uncharacterized protein (DUF2252 family)